MVRAHVPRVRQAVAKHRRPHGRCLADRHALERAGLVGVDAADLAEAPVARGIERGGGVDVATGIGGVGLRRRADAVDAVAAFGVGDAELPPARLLVGRGLADRPRGDLHAAVVGIAARPDERLGRGLGHRRLDHGHGVLSEHQAPRPLGPQQPPLIDQAGALRVEKPVGQGFELDRPPLDRGGVGPAYHDQVVGGEHRGRQQQPKRQGCHTANSSVSHKSLHTCVPRESRRVKRNSGDALHFPLASGPWLWLRRPARRRRSALHEAACTPSPREAAP